ncbi:MAG: trehalose-6-phosphate synthase, partial [Actinomycetota bacterium]|nr:trehalose-6-phosphate synthase [Actinomycetota bacterium]
SLMGDADLVVVSNRGPLSFNLDEQGDPVRGSSAGGLASTLGPLLAGSGATWIAAAMSEADRRANQLGLMEPDGIRLVTVEPSQSVYRMAYDVIANSTLWFIHHHLFDLPRRPRIDGRWHEAWQAFRTYSEIFADAVIAQAGPGATVLLQDYHLSLVPAMVSRKRPDLRVVHFTHTPFADPAALRVLPDGAAQELLAAMAGGACGFHAERWRAAFLACCEEAGVPAPATFVSALSPDAAGLLAEAESPGYARAAHELDDLVGSRRLVVRVDRVEPSKNLVRGFLAYDEMLQRHPEWREQVVMLAFAYPSRQSLADYLAYGVEAEQAARRVNDTWGTRSWTPVVYRVADDRARSMAALARYDVLLVNPIRDGLNLVAKEGPLVNTSGGVVALSREAGAFEELAPWTLEVNPFDISGTAEVLSAALALDDGERRRRSVGLRDLIAKSHPRQWLDDQISAAAPTGW